VTDPSLSGARKATMSSSEPTPPAVFLMTNTLETGGTERQFVTMSNALDRGKFTVHLGCLKRRGPFLSEVTGLEEFSPGGRLFGLRSWLARLALSRFLRQKRISVAHSFDFYSNLMLIPAARLARVPVVLGSHRQLGDLLTRNQFRAQNAMFRLCDRIVCNSRSAADRLREAGIAERKLTVIANGLPDELFSGVTPDPARDLQVERIGMISRMNDTVKRHDLFLRAAKPLAERFPQLRFVLVGDGPLRAGLEALADQLGLRNRVDFLGDRRDVPAVLATLDISVLPSASESLSNVILESMAAGVAVVAANVGGNPELVQNGTTGFLFPSGDDEQLCCAIETLVTQPQLRKQFGLCARQKAQAEYAISKIRDCYQELYRGLLSEKGWIASVPIEQLRPVGTGHEGV
jgi:glycosyltransferase involved in cell wall biosynthesis